MRASNWHDYRRQILQLSRDRGNHLTSGASLKDFQELGPHTGEHWPFTAEAVRRAFGEPKDREDPSSEYVENLRAASHEVFEKLLVARLRYHAPHLYAMWARVFPRDEGGDRDYERLKRRAQENGGWAKTDLWLCDLALNLLTDYAMSCGPNGEPLELIVEFPRARTLREERQVENRNSQLEAQYHDLRENQKLSESAAAGVVADWYGISVGRVRDIMRIRKLERGEAKKLPGRPKKNSA